MKFGKIDNCWQYLYNDDISTSYCINPHCGSDDFTYMIEESLDRIKPIPCEINRDSHLGSYSSFIGSPLSKGILQFDMWGVTPSDRWDWAGLKEKIAEHGIRNSLLMAPMPTASTAQILGNNESTEPFTSNMYNRR